MTYPNTPGFQQHSETSRAAADSLTTQHSMEADILRFLEHYPSGFTADELQEAFEGKLHPGVQAGTIAARLRGLELKEQILKTKETRRTRSNRQAQVWKHPRHCTPSEIAGAEPDMAKAEANEKCALACESTLREIGYGHWIKEEKSHAGN